MADSKKTNIGLGTVQFGLPYGVHAHEPLMPKETVYSILDLAVKSGIRFFDTAANYGEAETRLGEFGLASKTRDIEISSKIPAVSKNSYSNVNRYWKFVSNTIAQSKERLKLPEFHLLQFHQCEMAFLENPSVQKVMHDLIEEGLCDSIGISVYSPEEALVAIQIPEVRAIQFPVNLLDRRFLDPVLLQKLSGKNLIGRSVFLQGLLVSDVPVPKVKHKDKLVGLKQKAEEIAEELGESLETLALRFIFAELKNLPMAIIGVDSEESLKKNLETIEKVRKNSSQKTSTDCFQALSEELAQSQLLEPRFWNT